MSAGVERMGKWIGEWSLILGVVLMPLVIFTEGYRVATTPKFLVLMGVVFGIGIAVICRCQSLMWSRVPMLLPWFLFLVVTGVQAFRSLNSDAAIGMVCLQMGAGVVGVCAALLLDRFERVLRAVAIASILVSLIGVSEYLGFSWAMWPSAGRPSATLGFRNFAGMYLAVAFFLSGRLVFSESKKDHWLGLVAVVLISIFLVFTRTRGAWLGVAIACCCAVGLVWRSVGLKVVLDVVHKSKLKIVLSVALVIGLGIIPPQFEDVGASRLDENKTSVVQSLQFVTQEGGDRGRFKIWHHTMSMIAEAPLLGVGLDNWSAYYPRYDQGDVMGIVVAPRRPHNDFLWIWAELGLVGLGLYIWLLVTVLQNVWKEVRTQNWESVVIALGALALIVHSGFSFPREQPVAMFFFALTLGMAGQQKRTTGTSRHWFSVGAGVVCLVVSVCGMGVGWDMMRFNTAFAKALQAQSLSQKNRQADEALEARKYGIFDHRVFLVEGMARFDLKDYQGAIDVYETYLQYQPYLPAVYNNLGRSYENVGNVEAAEKAFLTGLETFSGDGAGILVSNLAALYKRQGKVDDALRLYESGVALPAEGHHNLGLIYAERRMWDKSLTEYREALARSSDMTIAYFSMAGVQMLQGDLENAAQNYEIFLKEWDGAQDYVRDAQKRLLQIYPVLGDRLLRSGKFQGASSFLIKQIELGASSPEIYNNLILIFGRLGQFERSLYFGQVGLLQYPDFDQYHLSLGTVYQDMGNRELALKHYRSFLAQNPANEVLVQRTKERITFLEKSKP